MTKPADADLIIEMLYRFAADPVAWEQLIDVLDDEGMAAPTGAAAADIARAQDIARLATGPGEGPHHEPWRADLGWIVLSPAGKVLVCNPLAETILRAGLGAAQVNRPLTLVDEGNAEAAARALAQVRRGAGQVVLRLERPGGEGPCFAYATSAAALIARVDSSQGPHAPLATNAVALVFPAPDAASRLWTGVQESFGLTEAEVRLARKLREGLSLQQAADSLGTSINTVRNQLRAVFDKMGLQRQSDLVRALTELGAVAGALDADANAAGISRVMADAPPVRSIGLRDGRRLAFRDYGDPDGRPLISFHEGLGSSLLPPGSQALAQELGLRIITPERPGYGQSDPRSGYSFESVAQDVVELCDRLGLGGVAVAGVMSGAPSALQTAARLGDRCELVMLCSARTPRARGAPPRSQSLMMSVRSRLEANPWIVEAIYAVVRLRRSPALTRQMVRRGASHSAGDQAYLEAHPELADYVWAYVGEALAQSSRGVADDMKAFHLARDIPAPDLARPAVVWHGAQDTLTSLPDVLAYLGDQAGEVRVVEGIGHLLTHKHWREILERVAREPAGATVP